VRDCFSGRGGWWYACLAIPSALLIGLVDAPQGYFRDWDMFAIAGLLLSVVSALAIGRFLSRAPQYAWLGAAVVLSTVLPCMQQLLLQSDSQAGLRRVAAFAEPNPPHRSAASRASVLAFLGKRAWDGGDVASAASYGRRAAELVPTPSMLTLWGDAEEEQGHLAAAESIYVRLAAASPTNIRAWLGLARVRLSSGRPLEAAAAAESALAIQPGSTYAADLLRAARASRPQ
jgi:tetratricopeptide (TPR) repeat protein